MAVRDALVAGDHAERGRFAAAARAEQAAVGALFDLQVDPVNGYVVSVPLADGLQHDVCCRHRSLNLPTSNRMGANDGSWSPPTVSRAVLTGRSAKPAPF